MKRKKINGRGLFAGAVLLFLGVFFLANLKLSKNPVKKFLTKETTFKELTEEVRTNYTSDDFSKKTSFININGLFARVIGNRECNDIILLKNNMLSQVIEKTDMEKQANAIIGLADYTKQMGIPFLYVQAPYKEDMEGTLYPIGRESYGNENADELLQLLGEGQVDTYDLRPMLSETAEQVEQYFFRTDHHWKFEAAFVAFQEVVKNIIRIFPEKEYDLTCTQWDQWESHTLEDLLLGSRGKRVGRWFAGVEDVTWYTPKFETKISRTWPDKQQFFTGDFETAILRLMHIDEEADYFERDSYCLYIGGEYPLVQLRNDQAVTDMKILIIRDSFTKPMMAYMSTMFSEIDAIDPRRLTECSVAEYVKRCNPDMVIFMVNPSVIGDSKYMSLGVEEALKAKEPTLTSTLKKNITIKPAESQDKQDSSITVENGKTYTLCFSDVEFTDGASEGIVVSLYDKTAKKVLYSGVFDLEYEREHGKFEWIFTTPKGTNSLCLRLYAGVPGATAGNGVIYKDVELLEWE